MKRRIDAVSLIGLLGAAGVLAAFLAGMAAPPAREYPPVDSPMLDLLATLGWRVDSGPPGELDPEAHVAVVLGSSSRSEPAGGDSAWREDREALRAFLEAGGFALSAGGTCLEGLAAPDGATDTLPSALVVMPELSPSARFDPDSGPWVHSAFKPAPGATVLAKAAEGAYAASLRMGAGTLLHFSDDSFLRTVDREYAEAAVLVHEALSPHWGKALYLTSAVASADDGSGSLLARLVSGKRAGAAGLYLAGAALVAAWALAAGGPPGRRSTLPPARETTAGAAAAGDFYARSRAAEAADSILAERFAARLRSATPSARDGDAAVRALATARGLDVELVQNLSRPEPGLDAAAFERRRLARLAIEPGSGGRVPLERKPE